MTASAKSETRSRDFDACVVTCEDIMCRDYGWDKSQDTVTQLTNDALTDMVSSYEEIH